MQDHFLLFGRASDLQTGESSQCGCAAAATAVPLLLGHRHVLVVLDAPILRCLETLHQEVLPDYPIQTYHKKKLTSYLSKPTQKTRSRKGRRLNAKAETKAQNHCRNLCQTERVPGHRPPVSVVLRGAHRSGRS